MADIELALGEGGAQVARADIPVPPKMGLAKFRAAVKAVESGDRLRHAADAVFEPPEGVKPGIAGIAKLAVLVDHQPHRASLVKALHKRQHSRFDGLADRLNTEAFLLGSLIFHSCTPHKLGDHRRIFTWLAALVMAFIFVYQAGVR